MSLDPLGHITLLVSNFKKSKKFYSGLLDFVGYKIATDELDSAGWASKEGFGFWIKPSKETKDTYKFDSPGIHHICFKARAKEEVDKLYTEYLLKNKIYIFDKPAQYPEYTPDYYAVYFADPDGIKLEFAWY